MPHALSQRLEDTLFTLLRDPPFEWLQLTIAVSFLVPLRSIVHSVEEIIEALQVIKAALKKEISERTIELLGQFEQGNPEIIEIRLRTAKDLTLRRSALNALWNILMQSGDLEASPT